jgi:hypothetical protein
MVAGSVLGEESVLLSSEGEVIIRCGMRLVWIDKSVSEGRFKSWKST